ncbi:MAG: hypothetical protein ACRYF2_12830 [Janthinobacterium lividum]
MSHLPGRLLMAASKPARRPSNKALVSRRNIIAMLVVRVMDKASRLDR